MRELHPLAQDLNAVFERDHPLILRLLSERGRAIYFPKLGILSQGAQAEGTSVNASIGIALEDDRTAMRLPSAAKLVSLPPDDVFPYVGAYGKKSLREAWCIQMREKNPSLKAETSLPVVTAGLTHALSIAGYLFFNPGDHVILPTPYWDNYELTFGLQCGVKLRSFPLFAGEGFNVEGLRCILSDSHGKTILFLNFPNNPTGYSPLQSEAREIVDAIWHCAESGHDVLVILDDAYFGLVYEEEVYRESLLSLLADLHERVLVVKVDGCSKEDYAWGLRVGFLTYAGKGATREVFTALEDKTAGVVRATVSNASHLGQSLLLQTFRSKTYAQEKAVKRALLQSRYLALKKELAKGSPFFQVLPCNSGYFLCLELQEGIDAEAVRQLLLNEYDTGVIALGNLIRIAFSSLLGEQIPTLLQNLEEACDRLCSSLRST